MQQLRDAVKRFSPEQTRAAAALVRTLIPKPLLLELKSAAT